MVILNFIKDYWVQITFLAGVFSTLFVFIHYLIESAKCSLRNDILSIYENAKTKGNKITRWELEAIKYSAELYFKLHGNSFVKDILKRVEQFELID